MADETLRCGTKVRVEGYLILLPKEGNPKPLKTSQVTSMGSLEVPIRELGPRVPTILIQISLKLANPQL